MANETREALKACSHHSFSIETPLPRRTARIYRTTASVTNVHHNALFTRAPLLERRRALADCPPASRIPGIFTAVSAYHVASQAGSPPIASPTALRGLPCHKSSTARRRSRSPHQRGLFEQDACTVRPRNARMHSATFNPSAAKAR